MELSAPFLIRRTAYAVVTFLIALVMIFLIPRLVAVNPVELIAASQQLPASATRQLTAQFGLDKPLYVQFLLYVENTILTIPPNLGYSYEYYPAKVWELISAAVPWTIFLVGSSVAIAATIGTLVGLVAGWKRGSRLDRGVTYSALTIQSLPYFWIAIILQILLAVVLRVFPVQGAFYVTDTSSFFSLTFLVDVIYHALLPMITLIVSTVPVYAIIMRNTVGDIVREDYMLVAESKGLKKTRLLFSYVMRNGLLPVISIIALNLGYVVGGALLVEIVFSYPGVGTLIYNAIQGHDYPMIQGVFYILSIAVIGANYIADIIYTYVDPRIRYS